MSDPGTPNNNYVATKSQDVVGVFDDAGNQLFADARAIQARVTIRAKVMEHPLESGAVFADHIVFQPVEIDLAVIPLAATYRDTFQEIVSAYLAKKTVVVQTKTDTYKSMAFMGMPYEQTSEMFDTVAIAIRMREAQFVEAQYAQLPVKKVKKKANSSTVKTGEKQAAPATKKQSSAAFDLIFGSGTH